MGFYDDPKGAEKTERAKKEKRMNETLKDEMNVKRFCRSRRHTVCIHLFCSIGAFQLIGQRAH